MLLYQFFVARSGDCSNNFSVSEEQGHRKLPFFGRYNFRYKAKGIGIVSFEIEQANLGNLFFQFFGHTV